MKEHYYNGRLVTDADGKPACAKDWFAWASAPSANDPQERWEAWKALVREGINPTNYNPLFTEDREGYILDNSDQEFKP